MDDVWNGERKRELTGQNINPVPTDTSIKCSTSCIHWLSTTCKIDTLLPNPSSRVHDIDLWLASIHHIRTFRQARVIRYPARTLLAK